MVGRFLRTMGSMMLIGSVIGCSGAERSADSRATVAQERDAKGASPSAPGAALPVAGPDAAGEQTVGQEDGPPASGSGAALDGSSMEDASGGPEGALAPYAHVVAVSASGSPNAYTFEVSVESADLDCSQYADWWEVLGLDGSLIYRRILQHSHTPQNGTTDCATAASECDKPGNTFTRSGMPVAVGADDVVIIRAHISPGGYNGTVQRGSVARGFAPANDIGSDFAAAVQDLPPQPDGCWF